MSHANEVVLENQESRLKWRPLPIGGALNLGLGLFGISAWMLGGRDNRLLPAMVLASILVGALAWEQATKSIWSKLLSLGGKVLSIPVFYSATGIVITRMGLPNRDETLINADRILSENFFPKGQISLWLDNHALLGPGTPLGGAITELLQLSYVSYYFWGYGLFFLLCWRWFQSERNQHSVSAITQNVRNLHDFVNAWVGAYAINFVCYVALPAIGPQFVFKSEYVTPLNGSLGLAASFREIVASNQAVLQDCFPSGHTAISWIVALMACRFAPRYGRITVWVAALITAATLYLRYHYVVDLLAAIPLIGVSLLLGRYFSSRPPSVLQRESH